MPTFVPFVLVDVFADTPLTGNPLAVVAMPSGCMNRPCPAVAREFNQSETTFLVAADAA